MSLEAIVAEGEHFVGPALNDSSRAQILKAARDLLVADDSTSLRLALPDTKIAGSRAVVLSLSREKAPALVGVGKSSAFETSLREAVAAVRKLATPDEINSGRIKIDVVKECGAAQKYDSRGRAILDPSLEGLWLPSGALLLLPEELSSRPLISEKGVLQSKALAAYLLGSRKISLEEDPGKPGRSYCSVKFDSFMEGANRDLVDLFRGNPTVVPEPDALLRVCIEAGDYLVRHQHEEGLFDYRYEPRTNEIIADYNEVRHAGTAYSLLDLYSATKDVRYRVAGERAIDIMLRWVRTVESDDREAIVYERGQAKLGGTALAIVAILKHVETTGETKWLDHAKKMGRFLLFQQQKDGRFGSKYFFAEKKDDPFESLYYPGEAVLALTRLHEADPDNPDWLPAAERGVDWLINVRDANKKASALPHDHWLLIALNELYPLTRNKNHLAHAERVSASIVAAQRKTSIYPDWIGSFYNPPRTTPVATRAEAMVAMCRLARESGGKCEPYLEALKKMAVFQMRCRISAENGMYLPRPDLARGGFRRSLTDWEVRIDYVQHDLSSLLGLRSILLQ